MTEKKSAGLKKGMKIAIVFDDGSGTVSKKDGEFLTKDSDFFYLLVENEQHLIPISRIIRIKIKDDDKDACPFNEDLKVKK